MGKASTKAKNKYNANVYDQISIKPPKGTKIEWQAEAERQGENLTEYITNAVKMRVEADRKREEDVLLEDFYNQDISVLEKVANPYYKKMIHSGGKSLKSTFQIEKIGDINLFLEVCGNIDDVYKKVSFDIEQREEVDIFIKAYTSKRKAELEEAKSKLVSTPANEIDPEKEHSTLLFLTVEELDFTVRTLNTIKRVGINTIGDFCEFTKNHKLSEIRNCYRHNALEIINKIKEYDYRYKASLDIDYDNLMEQIETLPDYNRHK